MNHLQMEERYLQQSEQAHGTERMRNAKGMARASFAPSPHVPTAPQIRKQLGADPLPQPVQAELALYAVESEQACEDCAGTGRDWGTVGENAPEECSHCRGTGKETVTRNFLAEAFRIAADPGCTAELKREHLVAIINHARQAVSAFANLPEAA